ncbi:MAG TPA: Gfo/Idh/MocA family oxidoreductase [Mycobacteriales bacterium]|jgi:predicted dehydrogenase|nr:Gfo/Idh/MocA family oxidoreductase [Mycobacteriales bacterium]
MPAPVRFAAIGLDHAHIFGQIAGLLRQGCIFAGYHSDLADSSVYAKVAADYPDVPDVPTQALLEDPAIDLVVTAAVPSERAGIAIAAMEHGKDVIADKPGCTSLEDLERLRTTVAATKRFWSVTFSERFEVRCVSKATELVQAGRIGKVIQTLGLGPHRIGSHLSGGRGRPDWFWDPNRFGGILTDIASHQIDQFLWFTGSTRGEVVASTVGNFGNPEHPDMQDFGEVLLRSDNAQGYIRCDWFTPDGLPTWGDGRLTILGTEGYLEMRKYVDIAGRPGGNHLFFVDKSNTEYIDCSETPLSYYGDLVNDVLNRTETACPQEHTFETMRLALQAQQNATVRKA